MPLSDGHQLIVIYVLHMQNIS